MYTTRLWIYFSVVLVHFISIDLGARTIVLLSVRNTYNTLCRYKFNTHLIVKIISYLHNDYIIEVLCGGGIEILRIIIFCSR